MQMDQALVQKTSKGFLPNKNTGTGTKTKQKSSRQILQRAFDASTTGTNKESTRSDPRLIMRDSRARGQGRSLTHEG